MTRTGEGEPLLPTRRRVMREWLGNLQCGVAEWFHLPRLHDPVLLRGELLCYDRSRMVSARSPDLAYVILVDPWVCRRCSRPSDPRYGRIRLPSDPRSLP